MHKTFLFTFSVLFSLALFFCSASFAETKVGVILPMSGDFARYGDKIRQGLEKTRSPNVKFIYEDEGCNPKSAVTAHKKLSSFDQINLFLGPWCGSPQVAVASQLTHDKQIAILGSSAPRRVFELSKGRMLAVQHSIEEESTFNAQKTYELGAKKVVIVFWENDFSRAHEAAFKSNFKGEVLETLVYTSPDASALRTIATRIKQLNPDTLYVPDASPLMHGLVTQLNNIGLMNIKIFSVYSAQFDEVHEVVGNVEGRLFYSYPKINDDALNYFPQLASKILMEGIQACPDTSPDCILKEIKGRYQFDEYGVMKGTLGLKTVKDGLFVWVDEKN